MFEFPKFEMNRIIVFPSNLAGRHGAGLAKEALKWGAKRGKAEGLWNNTYAIPTKDENIKTMSLFKINFHVDRFIDFAEENLQFDFYVSEIGCGLAGYTPSDIAPMFIPAKHLKNVILPESFQKIINAQETTEAQ